MINKKGDFQKVFLFFNKNPFLNVLVNRRVVMYAKQ